MSRPILTNFVAFSVLSIAPPCYASDNFALDVVEHFQKGCPASLSQNAFIDYFKKAGAEVKEVTDPKLPFRFTAVLSPTQVLGTYYATPRKCCVSAMIPKANAVDYFGWVTQALSVSDIRLIQEGRRKAFLFAPRYSNRITAMDWDSKPGSDSQLMNLCQSDHPGAEKFYSTTGKPVPHNAAP